MGGCGGLGTEDPALSPWCREPTADALNCSEILDLEMNQRHLGALSMGLSVLARDGDPRQMPQPGNATRLWETVWPENLYKH